MPPHVFSISDNAYRDMLQGEREGRMEMGEEERRGKGGEGGKERGGRRGERRG